MGAVPRIGLARATESIRGRLRHEFTPSLDDFGPLLLGATVVNETKVLPGDLVQDRGQGIGQDFRAILPKRLKGISAVVLEPNVRDRQLSPVVQVLYDRRHRGATQRLELLK